MLSYSDSNYHFVHPYIQNSLQLSNAGVASVVTRERRAIKFGYNIET